MESLASEITSYGITSQRNHWSAELLVLELLVSEIIIASGITNYEIKAPDSSLLLSGLLV